MTEEVPDRLTMAEQDAFMAKDVVKLVTYLWLTYVFRVMMRR